MIFYLNSACTSFSHMLTQRRPVAQLCQWITGLVETHVKPSSQITSSSDEAQQQQQQQTNLVCKLRRLLSTWQSVTAKLIHQLQLIRTAGQDHSSASSMTSSLSKFFRNNFSFRNFCKQYFYFTGSFQLLHLLLNEFLLHEVERLVCEDSMRELMVNMVNSQATELPDSAFVESLGPDFLSNPGFHQRQMAEAAAASNGRQGRGTVQEWLSIKEFFQNFFLMTGRSRDFARSAKDPETDSYSPPTKRSAKIKQEIISPQSQEWTSSYPQKS